MITTPAASIDLNATERSVLSDKRVPMTRLSNAAAAAALLNANSVPATRNEKKNGKHKKSRSDFRRAVRNADYDSDDLF